MRISSTPHHLERPTPRTRPLRPTKAQQEKKQKKKKPVDMNAPAVILISHSMYGGVGGLAKSSGEGGGGLGG